MDQRSYQAQAWRSLYNTAHWKALRFHQLSQDPLCCMCKAQNTITIATIVDHKIPHKGDERLFFDENNLQSMCKPHHDAAKQAEEKRGYSSAVDARGWPTDPLHPANRDSRGGGPKV
jgi:5-methylcytosine-specific restriction protein A